MVLGGGREVELGEDRRDVLLDRALGDDELAGDRGVGAALGHQPQHLALARGQRLQRVLAAAAAEQQRDDLGIERRAAAGDAAHRVGEGVDVGDAVLEQVAGALGRLREQLDRVGLLDVLGEHEHADVGVVGADLVRGAQALVGVGGRHPDVDDGDVGVVGADLAQQVLGVTGLAGDLEARLLEQAREALAQQHGVVGQHDAKRVTHGRDSSRARGARECGRPRARPSGRNRGPRSALRAARSPTSRGSRRARSSGPLPLVELRTRRRSRRCRGAGRRAGRGRGAARLASAIPDVAVSSLADDVEPLGLEQHAGARTKGGVVVDDEDGQSHREAIVNAETRSAIRLATPPPLPRSRGRQRQDRRRRTGRSRRRTAVAPACAQAPAVVVSTPPSTSRAGPAPISARRRSILPGLAGMNGWPPQPGLTVMQSARSRSAATSASTRDGRGRADRHAGGAARLLDRADRVVHVRGRLGVEGDVVGAGLGELGDLALGPLDHQVHVDQRAGAVDLVGERGDDAAGPS